MRTSCLECICKHVAQAAVLMDESGLGHPSHQLLAMGHLAEAECESLKDFPHVARAIREIRVDRQGDYNLLELLEWIIEQR